MLIQSAMIGIEIVGVPLETSAGGALGVIGPVIQMYRQYIILTAKQHLIGEVDAVRRDAVFRQTNRLGIEKNLAGLTHPVEH